MKRLLLPIVLIVTPAIARDVSVLDDLKSTPVTSYEAGRNQLATFTTAINLIAKFEGKNEVAFALLEDELTLGFEVSTFKPVKKVTNAECNAFFSMLKSKDVVSALPTLIWPSLSPEQAKAIQNELFIQAKIIAKENHEFSVSCKKSLAEI